MSCQQLSTILRRSDFTSTNIPACVVCASYVMKGVGCSSSGRLILQPAIQKLPPASETKAVAQILQRTKNYAVLQKLETIETISHRCFEIVLLSFDRRPGALKSVDFSRFSYTMQSRFPACAELKISLRAVSPLSESEATP